MLPARAAFHSAVITLRAARRRIKRSPEGKIRSPRTGNMEKCYVVTRSERVAARLRGKKVACSAFVPGQIEKTNGESKAFR